MITPTVGRVVLFYPKAEMDQPYAATVAHVWSDRCVNLGYLDSNGNSGGATSVPLIQEGDTKPDSFYCEWMPYQVGQAKKHEQDDKDKERRDVLIKESFSESVLEGSKNDS